MHDADGVAATLQALGLTVFERGWLSSNGVLCNVPGLPTTLVDTGYGSHAELITQLVQTALGPRALDHIVNTHLHSDHCGGNAALQRLYPRAQTAIPQTMLQAVQAWDKSVLTYQRTQQQCERFVADRGMRDGDDLMLGETAWQVHAAPGHDPDALMLFEPQHRVLISGDALWERRLAIVFPELEGAEGFASNAEALNRIERLQPDLVIPGHGRSFTDVAGAIEGSRQRLARYRKDPDVHRRHAQRALLMFHMLEHHARAETEVIAWFCSAPILSHGASPVIRETAQACINDLLSNGVLTRQSGMLQLA